MTDKDKVREVADKLGNCIQAMCERWYIKRGHGPCCTCQICGHHYDDCFCGDIAKIQDWAESELRALVDNHIAGNVWYKDPLEAALVRLGHRPIQLKHQVEGGKWRWSCHVQEAHTLDWYKTTGDTPSEAVAAAEKEIEKMKGD